MASGTSRKTELKLVGVARASLEELLLDYQDFLRQKGLALWGKGHPEVQEIRQKAYVENRSYETYRPYVESSSPEVAANALVCLIHRRTTCSSSSRMRSSLLMIRRSRIPAVVTTTSKGRSPESLCQARCGSSSWRSL